MVIIMNNNTTLTYPTTSTSSTEESWTFTHLDGTVEHWAPAIYDGHVVAGLYVSDRGWMRRGRWGQTSKGTPAIDPRHPSYIKQMMVCVKDSAYKHGHRAVNLHRIVLETFGGVKWVDGCQLDHINRCTTDGRVENLRMLTRKQNMANRNLVPPTSAPSSIYRYAQCRKFDVRRVKDLPLYVQRTYRRMLKAESLARRAKLAS